MQIYRSKRSRRPVSGLRPASAGFGVLLSLVLASPAPAQDGTTHGLPLRGVEAEEFLQDAEVIDREDIPIGITKPQRLTLRLGESAPVRLQATYMNGSPMVGAKVSGGEEDGVTDEQGRCELIVKRTTTVRVEDVDGRSARQILSVERPSDAVPATSVQPALRISKRVARVGETLTVSRDKGPFYLDVLREGVLLRTLATNQKSIALPLEADLAGLLTLLLLVPAGLLIRRFHPAWRRGERHRASWSACFAPAAAVAGWIVADQWVAAAWVAAALEPWVEAASALGTVGLSTGVTPTLTWLGKIIIIVVMLVGRLGPLTLLAALTEFLQPCRALVTS